ncbi:MAG: tetratricopeptide repeat protein [Candidatus Competibacteraceae bacterium]|nr:tetratricopeptide repeat protein [Candidatus Competibacteraceae bacterium]
MKERRIASILASVLSLMLGLSFLPAYAMTLAEADQLLLQGKLKAAEEAYRELQEEDETGDAAAGLSVTLAKQGWPSKIVEAEKILKKAREKHADNPNVLAAAGYVAFVHSKTVASPAKRDLYLEAAESLAKKAINQNTRYSHRPSNPGSGQNRPGRYRSRRSPSAQCLQPGGKLRQLDPSSPGLAQTRPQRQRS